MISPKKAHQITTVKESADTNLFIQAGVNLGIEVGASYSLQANSIKETSSLNELIANNGISLKCGGNTLTVDSSGIHFNTANYDANSGNGGVSSKAISIEDLVKPLYEKIRVINVEANLVKQDKITQELVYTAKVEKYTNGERSQTTDLQESQLLQLNWHFIKNNDETDTELLQDNPTDDDITIDGLTMRVTLQDDNKEQFGHAHCFVVEADEENCHAISELKRQLDVQEVLGRNLYILVDLYYFKFKYFCKSSFKCSALLALK